MRTVLDELDFLFELAEFCKRVFGAKVSDNSKRTYLSSDHGIFANPGMSRHPTRHNPDQGLLEHLQRSS